MCVWVGGRAVPDCKLGAKRVKELAVSLRARHLPLARLLHACMRKCVCVHTGGGGGGCGQVSCQHQVTFWHPQCGSPLSSCLCLVLLSMCLCLVFALYVSVSCLALYVSVSYLALYVSVLTPQSSLLNEQHIYMYATIAATSPLSCYLPSFLVPVCLFLPSMSTCVF